MATKTTTKKSVSSTGYWSTDKANKELHHDGIFDRHEVYAEGKSRLYDQFARFGFMDPYSTITGAREYLFFTKPDLNLFSTYTKQTTKSRDYSETKTQGVADKLDGKVKGATWIGHSTGTNSNLNPDLANYPFFIELKEKYPQIGEQLQLSLKSKEPFMKILSNSVKNTLDLPDISTRQVETAQTVYGTSIQYEADDLSSDEGFTFDLEFEDTNRIEVYMLFKTWHEYLRKKSFGLVEPIWNKYRFEKILHDQIAIFKFIVADDGETIIHYSKLYGCRPQGVPRSTFSDLGSNLPLRFNVNWRAEFVEDMEPMILTDFNILNQHRKGKVINIYDSKNLRTNTEPADFARIVVSNESKNKSFRNPETKVYKLKWYKET